MQKQWKILVPVEELEEAVFNETSTSGVYHLENYCLTIHNCIGPQLYLDIVIKTETLKDNSKDLTLSYEAECETVCTSFDDEYEVGFTNEVVIENFNQILVVNKDLSNKVESLLS